MKSCWKAWTLGVVEAFSSEDNLDAALDDGIFGDDTI